jgi:serine/threonine protein kinase
MVIQKSRNLKISKRRLLKNPRVEIAPLLQHKVHKERISELISLMLQEEFDERISLVDVIKHPYFHDFIKEYKEICDRVYPKLANLVKQSLTFKPKMDLNTGRIGSFRSIGPENPEMDHTKVRISKSPRHSNRNMTKFSSMKTYRH